MSKTIRTRRIGRPKKIKLKTIKNDLKLNRRDYLKLQNEETPNVYMFACVYMCDKKERENQERISHFH